MEIELTAQVISNLNDVCSHLAVGSAWHKRAANEVRKFYITRGWGRWHEEEAECDDLALTCLTKILKDNVKFIPTLNTTSLAKAYNYTLADFEAFKKHHTDWIEREERFIVALQVTRAAVIDVNFELYEKICKMLPEVQNETMRVDWVHGSCTMTNWEPHDVKVTSRWLHEYFEHEYKGGKIDFNIG